MSKNKPIDSKRVGNIEAALWVNKAGEAVILNSTFARVYKKKDGEFGNTQSFALSDLWRLVRAATWAYTRGHELQKEYEAEAEDAPKKSIKDVVTKLVHGEG